MKHSWYRRLAVLTAVIPLLMVAASAPAQEEETGEYPTARVYFSGTQFGLILQAGWGGGRIEYKGDNYAFKLKGLKIGAIGPARMKTLRGLAFDWAKAGTGKRTGKKTVYINSDSTLVFSFLFILTNSNLIFLIIEMIIPLSEWPIKRTIVSVFLELRSDIFSQMMLVT